VAILKILFVFCYVLENTDVMKCLSISKNNFSVLTVLFEEKKHVKKAKRLNVSGVTNQA
jgi:hypothetical protein